MLRFKLTLVVATIAAILVVVVPSMSSAQICADCDWGEGFCATYPGDHHQDYETDGESGSHYDPEQAWHWSCVAGEGMDCGMHGNECMDNGRLKLLETALKAEDVVKAVSVLASTDRFLLNAERNAIQMKACSGGAIVRNIALSPALFASLETQLALHTALENSSPHRVALPQEQLR
jgi:hypothetical protein